MITRRGALTLIAAAAALPRLARAQDSLPRNPRVINLSAMGRKVGTPGGTLRMLVGGQRDVRFMPIYSYSRLVGYDETLKLVPDILEAVEVDEARAYTLHLREGHRWSDGSPFTSEDFRYVWQDMMKNPELYRGGPPADLLADGIPCKFEAPDALTVRYVWPTPMPDFLPKLAAPAPLILTAPSAYLRQFHATYTDEATLARLIEEQRVDDWPSLHAKMGRQNRPENPDLPTLEAWRPRTAPPAERFVFERNPYFHRVDEAGQQLPYLDRVELNVASAEVIGAKTATGESDLQAAGIGFSDYTLLKHAETVHPVKVALWRRTQGSAVSLLPNLTCNDAAWRQVFRDVRVRRAMSVAINREEINKVLFFGLARESADTVLPDSPLYRPEYASAWSQYDPGLANALLDETGLLPRKGKGKVRHLTDGRKAGIVVETAGESALEVDVLELVTDHFRAIGIPLYIRASQRDIFRSRALAGEVTMAVWTGLDNAVPTLAMAPDGLAPTNGEQLQWPMWGMHYGSAQTSGTPPEDPAAQELLTLLGNWRRSTTPEVREAVWHRMLAIRADQVFTIGTVNGALQPILKAARLRNVPEKALYGFEPTSYFGAYRPDTFFYDGGV